VARAISWLGHPLVFITLAVTLVVVLQMRDRTGLLVLLVLLFSLVLPTGFLLFRGVRSGAWSDVDVSVREERKRFYPKAIPFSILSVLLLWFLHAPGFVLRATVVTLGLLVVAGLANLRIKLSLHALFAFYCTAILFRMGLVAGFCALVLALLVFWSRLHLQRHDLGEMVVGALLGTVGGIAAVWWP